MSVKETMVMPPQKPTVQNYPNPFSSVTSIRYTIPAEAPVNLSVYNQLGQRVAVLANGKQLAGTHIVSFNALNRPAGIYLYQLTTRDENGEVIVLSGKMLLAK
jgi:serine protease AprX